MLTIEKRTAHHVIAIAQHHDAATPNPVPGYTAGEGADLGQCEAVVKIDSTGIWDGPQGIITRIRDDEVTIGKHGDRRAELAAVRRAMDVKLAGAATRKGGEGEEREEDRHCRCREPS